MSREKYLLRKYGISEADYEQMLAEQDQHCAICGRPPGTRRLHVDHDHAVERTKIRTQKLDKHVWVAGTEHPAITQIGTTRLEAVQKVRRALLRLSVRGLLCWHCNTLLQKAYDDASVIRNAAAYLDRYQQKLKGKLCDQPDLCN